MNWMLMPLKRYAEFNGRSRRMEFWMWKLFVFLVGMVFWTLMMIIGGAALASGDANGLAAAGGGMIAIMGLYMLFALGIFIPDLAVTVRRLHDTDRTGWWILAPLGPYIVAFIAMFGGAASGSQEGMATGGLIGVVAMLAVLVLGIVLLVFLFLDGTPGPNRYGEDPKAAERGAPRTVAT